MPDRRRHRGAHPEDARLFADDALPRLRRAVGDLCWLLERGYPPRAALDLVGNHSRLTERQRLAVRRCACSDAQRAERLVRTTTPDSMPDAPVWIDGFNVVTSVESALGGGVLLLSRDGALRDMASVHGSYRLVEETHAALIAIAETLERRRVRRCRWLLDTPVSNSGRLKTTLLDLAHERGLAWEVELNRFPDRALECAPEDVIVASADSRIMDRAPHSWQLARETIEGLAGKPWIVDLTGDPSDDE